MRTNLPMGHEGGRAPWSRVIVERLIWAIHGQASRVLSGSNLSMTLAFPLDHEAEKPPWSGVIVSLLIRADLVPAPTSQSSRRL
jgi:hypothetical protein